MKTFNSLKLLPILAAGLFLAPAAFAETSDWMKGYDSFRFGDKLAKEGVLITRIECKDSGKVSLDYDSALVRLTYEKNPKKIGWLFTGGLTCRKSSATTSGRAISSCSTRCSAVRKPA